MAALRDLRDAARELLRLEGDPGVTDEAIAPVRARAADRYAHYVRTWGPLNRGELREGPPDPDSGEPALSWRRPGLGGFRRDPDYWTVMALEDYDSSTGTARPAPILQRRVHGRPVTVGRPDGLAEVLLAVTGSGGAEVDLERVATLAGLPDAASAAAALGDRIWRDPERDGAWVSAREYLSGDLRARTAAAEQAAAADDGYLRNVAALRAATPPELGPADIAVTLGAPWIAPADIEAFVREELDCRVTVHHLPSAAYWKVVATGRQGAAARRYGTPRMKPLDVLAAGLNGRLPIVVDRVASTIPGKRVARRDLRASLEAQERLTALQERFRTWLWEDRERTARLVTEYNRRFNTHVVQRVDGSELTFPGLADGVELWPWQRDVVAQVVSSPATLCAHAVGAGKTKAMVCSALTARRLGLAAKPLIAVPAHLLEQVAREARQTYPFGRFLIAGEVEARDRAMLSARCATGDWDAVIVSHGTLSALPVAPTAEAEWLEHSIDRVRGELRGGAAGGHGRAVLRRRLALLQEQAAKLRVQEPPPLTFDDLGVDLLLVDEAHYFKRLPITSRREGIPLGASARAADLMLKANLLRLRHGRRPTLALFTGTPWSNTIAETFVWQSFVQPDVLAAAGIEHFDAWAAVFAEYETLVEVSADSAGFRLMQRPTSVRNLPELQRMLAMSADIVRPSELGLELPERREETLVCPASPGQARYVRTLAARADKIRREQVRAEPGEDNMLSVCGDGRRAALDPRLVGVAEDAPRLATIADTVARIHHENAATTFPGNEVPGVLQVVFCDQGTPGRDGPQTYGRLRHLLVDRGVPDDAIRWVHAARTPAARTALFADCRVGRVAVLLGSTDKLGVGTNVQARLRAVHHADAPWRPSDIEQREGRAFRPGNHNAVVDVYRYVTEGTFDAYMWQTLQRKATFIEQLYRVDPHRRSAADFGDAVLTFAEVKALASGNSLLLEHTQASAAVARLRLLEAVDAQNVTDARKRRERAESEQYAQHQRELRARAARARLHESDGESDAEVEGVRALAARFRARLADRSIDDPAPVRGRWCGLGLELLPAGGWRGAGDTVALRVTLEHRRVDELVLRRSALARSDAGAGRTVLKAVRAWCASLDTRIEDLARAAAEAYDEAEAAGRVLREHRFSRADELAAAEAYLAELGVALEVSLDS
jgi:N12 class adenine-specific DNA methylase